MSNTLHQAKMSKTNYIQGRQKQELLKLESVGKDTKMDKSLKRKTDDQDENPNEKKSKKEEKMWKSRTTSLKTVRKWEKELDIELEYELSPDDESVVVQIWCKTCKMYSQEKSSFVTGNRVVKKESVFYHRKSHGHQAVMLMKEAGNTTSSNQPTETQTSCLNMDSQQMASKDVILSSARQFLKFVNNCPSPYHAVHEVKTRLVAAGFRELREAETWDVKPCDKCFVTKNQSTIIAFAIGGQYKAGNGFSIVGAHTDSPCLKVKPISKVNKCGYNMVGVECYGGGIWHTWFDRDLTVGGRVLVKRASGKIDHCLVHINKPILRIPHIAIHLQRDHNEKFSANKETHVCPVLATAVQSQLNESKQSEETKGKEEKCQSDKHQPILMKLICDELQISPEQILDFDIHLADTQPAVIGGALEEFIFSARLDNLLNAYTATVGLIQSCADSSLEKDTNIRMISLFDNEEVGSQSAQGAQSSFQEFVLRRLSSGGSRTAFEEAIPKSLMVSADQAHAVHPNYSEKHEMNHQPGLHKGIVFKINSNQRYASTAITNTILREIARIVQVPIQDFVVRNDSPCGSTIGPIMSAKLGMPTIDIGAPQLSMHSIREMCCTSSVWQAEVLYKGFFEHYPEVYNSLNF